MLKFTPVTYKDLVSVKELQPDGWPDITDAFLKYISWEYCYSVKVTDDENLVGLGTYIVFEKTAWLAHIIVHKDHRKQGIGFQIVEYLMKRLEEISVQTILLIATELGEPVYKKAGFMVVSDYISLKKDQNREIHPDCTKIQPYSNKYYNDVMKMDFRITGEKREWLIKEHLDKALIYVENEILKGIYLPDLGEGAIYTDSTHAGIDLMQMKYVSTDKAVIPAENMAGIEFLLNNGFIHNGIKGKRMIYGNDIAWKPEGFFSRIGGNLG
ncbi:MAG: GNAT family N-acetyltransferase [Bacteroidales bacterium]|nr:GNAT family N-acetyltransferase [Bacteroidales bacterium]